jgi:hypothetical protein
LNGDGRIDEIGTYSSPADILIRNAEGGLEPAVFGLPEGITVGPTAPVDALRLVDVNGDGKADCLFSNHDRYCLYLFKDMQAGWATKVFDVIRGQEDAAAKETKTPVIPPFVRADGTNNGAFFHSNCLWLQNEDTRRLPDWVFKLPFADMLAPLQP